MVAPRIPSLTVEFLRFGCKGRVYCTENEYLRTKGFDQLVDAVRPEINRVGLLKLLRRLRYTATAAGVLDGADEAATSLAAEAARFLPPVPVRAGRLSQLDVVTMASELWALPLEACYAAHPEWLDGPESGVVVTRRIRAGFVEQVLPWPEAPRVLFAHGRPTRT